MADSQSQSRQTASQHQQQSAEAQSQSTTEPQAPQCVSVWATGGTLNVDVGNGESVKVPNTSGREPTREEIYQALVAAGHHERADEHADRAYGNVTTLNVSRSNTEGAEITPARVQWPKPISQSDPDPVQSLQNVMDRIRPHMADNLAFFEAAEKRIAEDILEDQRKQVAQKAQADATREEEQNRPIQQSSERDAKPSDKAEGTDKQETTVTKGVSQGSSVKKGVRKHRSWLCGF